MSESTNNGVLTRGLVINKTKCDNLENVKNLNLWGNELEVGLESLRISGLLGRCLISKWFL